VNGCLSEPKVCNVSSIGVCQTTFCDDTVGCLPVAKTCIVTDADCYLGVCNNVTGACSQIQRPNFGSITSQKKGGIICAVAYNNQVIAGIAAGAVAGIVVGAVIFAALAAFAGKKAYDWIQMQNSGMGAAQGNPLYTPSAGSGTNPMYN
jgi:hypothetical protein